MNRKVHQNDCLILLILDTKLEVPPKTGAKAILSAPTMVVKLINTTKK